MTIFTATIIFFQSTIAPVLAATTGNSTVSSSSSGLEFSAQPIWDELAITTSSAKINQTHSIVSFIGNGTMTVPGTGQTVKMTNNGTGLVYPVPGYAETVSAVGREHVLSTEDADKQLSHFMKLYGMTQRLSKELEL